MNLENLLRGGLPPEFDWELIPVPVHGDKMMRLRTLEEALDQFENQFENQSEQQLGEHFENHPGDELQRYLVQVRPRKNRPAHAEISRPGEAGGEKRITTDNGVYLPDGSLNLDYLMENAELLVSATDYALARNIYKRVVQTGQSSLQTSRALLGMAKCFECENQPEEARKKYEESIAYHASFETYQRLANLLLSQNKPYQAAETLERSLHLKDLSPRIRYELHKAAGNSWMRSCEMASAERNYRKALEIDPSADEIQANLGALYLHAEKIEEARRRFQDALAANPRNDKAFSGLGSCFLAMGDRQNAHDHFARALQINLHNPQAIFHLVKCAYHLKSYATAANVVEKYIEVAPVNINLLYSLAGLHFHLGRVEESRAKCEKILELNPNHAGSLELLGMMKDL
jgi:tetratricopeptide (TPR) repeat protein